MVTQNTRSVQVMCPCIFCHNNHYNDECTECTTVSERKKILSQQKRCFICLKTGHMLKQCPSLHKKACCYCGKRNNHNQCLCPENFSTQHVESFKVTGQDCNSDQPEGDEQSCSTQQQQQPKKPDSSSSAAASITVGIRRESDVADSNCFKSEF